MAFSPVGQGVLRRAPLMIESKLRRTEQAPNDLLNRRGAFFGTGDKVLGDVGRFLVGRTTSEHTQIHFLGGAVRIFQLQKPLGEFSAAGREPPADLPAVGKKQRLIDRSAKILLRLAGGGAEQRDENPDVGV